VQRVAAGEDTALAELYDASSAFVYGLALRILADAAAAEEVTLDVYHQAWQQAHRFDPRRGPAHTWLLAIARSRSIDRLRSRDASRQRSVPLAAAARSAEDPRPDPQAQAMLADRGARVRRALQSVAPEQREVIELAFFGGLSHGQISAKLELPLGTVKTRIRSGMRRLAEALPFEDEA
jgi:RNA polymerase sigma-70 factor (ECF subfamily)